MYEWSVNFAFVLNPFNLERKVTMLYMVNLRFVEFEGKFYYNLRDYIVGYLYVAELINTRERMKYNYSGKRFVKLLEKWVYLGFFYKHRGYKHRQAQIWLRFFVNFKKIVVRKEIGTWKVSVAPQKHFKHTIRGRVRGEIAEILPKK